MTKSTSVLTLLTYKIAYLIWGSVDGEHIVLNLVAQLSLQVTQLLL